MRRHRKFSWFAERHFQKEILRDISSLDSKVIVRTVLEEADVRANYHNICRSADVIVDKETAKNLLECLVLLYVRVRAHSHAKAIKERHKVAKKSTKKRSLRTEIKQSSSTKDLGH